MLQEDRTERRRMLRWKFRQSSLSHCQTLHLGADLPLLHPQPIHCRRQRCQKQKLDQTCSVDPCPPSFVHSQSAVDSQG